MSVAARLPLVGVALALALTVTLWARALFGPIAGLLSLGAVVFEPTVLGHGHLVTADVSLAFGMVAAIACYERFLRSRRLRWLLPCGLATGWALLSKVTGLEVLAIIGLMGLLLSGGGVGSRLLATARSVAMVAAVAWAVVCLAYLPFQSALAASAPELANGAQFHSWGAPLSWVAPPPWVFSLLFQSSHAQSGHLTYLNGVVSDHGAWGYYLEALALKSTLGLLLLVAAAAAWTAWRRDRWVAVALWLPIAVVVLVASAGGLDLGVRYVLPVYPLAAVAAGSLALGLPALLRARLVAAGALVLVLAAASLAQFPEHIGYTNLVAGSRPEQYLGDSNLGWRQDYWRLAQWWNAHGRPPLTVRGLVIPPIDRYGIVAREVNDDSEVVNGLFVTDTFTLSLRRDRPAFQQLLRSGPVARVGTDIAIFDVHDATQLVGPDTLPTPPPCPR
jgi:4-amino-4-deoxy-L-arabinose transferase-like glycosyltransferase